VASFTEQATLKVVDKSSAQLRKINAELKKLFATAKSLKSTSVSIKVSATGLTKATAEIRKLNAEVRKLRSMTASIKVNASGLNAANAQIARLRRQASQPITVRTQHAGGGGPANPRAPGTRTGGGGFRRTPGSAFLGGIGGGIGVGLGRLNESFGLVALAGYGAAKALRAVANAAEKRDRAELAVDTQTSPAQRAMFKKLDEEAKKRGDLPPALRYKTDQFNLTRSSFQGDVGNSDLYNTPEKMASKAAQEERAERADVLARTLYKDFVPGIWARDNTMTQEGSQEELKKLSQVLGTMTEKVFETKDGKQVLSADANRVLEGIQLGIRAAPDVTLSQIKTMGASLKSLGYTATPQQIAEVIFNVSAKGQRAAGEAYQMYRAGQGTVDIGKLNYSIEKLGGFIEGTAQPGKKPGTIKAGTGIPREFDDPENPDRPIRLGEQPSEWWRRLLAEPQAKKKLADDMATVAAASLGKGATAKQKKAAADEARARAERGDSTAAERADFVNRTLSGARGTALQAILDSWLGGGIAKAGIAQAEGTPGPREIETMMAERWSAQLTNLGTSVSNAAGDLGKLGAEAIGLANILRGMNSFVEQNPLTSGAIAIAIGAAVTAAVLTPFAMLIRAASAMSRAAAIIGGGTVAAAGATGTVIGTVGTLGKVMKVGGTLMRVANGVGIALTAAEVTYYLATRSAEQAQKDMDQANAVKDITRKQERLAALEAERKVQQDTGVEPAPNMAAKLAKDAEEIARLRADIAKLKTVLDEKPVEAVSEDKIPTQSEVNALVAKAVADALASERAKAKDPKPTEPVKSTATDRAEAAAAAAAAAKTTTPPAAATTAAATPAPDSLAALIPQLAKTSESITLSISGLTTAGNTFTTVFNTGATAIKGAGETAATTLSNAAPGIGTAIGNAAAKAISAAAAQVSINVNHTGEQPNTGRSAPQ
jgi:hypothetical protein